MPTILRNALIALAAVALAWSLWRSAGWLQLCVGLAIFLFGMQCLEDGLRQLAGGRLEQLLARSTGTASRGLLFGIGGTALLQSSTLVSLLTIAFISSGLIQLAGGIAVILGANLGATSGIWLLALAGQNVSLAPVALPMLVFGVLAGFAGGRGRAAGRIVLGIAFILLGIDQIKSGFAAFGGDFDFSDLDGGGVAGTLLFVAVGLLATLVLQSSHATLMLTLAALAGGQLALDQALAVAIGSNVGSSVSTAIVGALGGNRSGQRLALAHVLFNGITAGVALALLLPLGWLVGALARLAGLGDNALLQLALFHTLFNALGVALFWPWQARLAELLQRWLPEHPGSPATIASGHADDVVARARHLSGQALESVDAAAAAVSLELEHLGQRSLEVIRQALCLPADALHGAMPDTAALAAPPGPAACADADVLYRREVKGVYGDLLDFMGRMELPLDEAHQRFWTRSQLAAMQIVEAVKAAKHLQKNLRQRLQDAPSPLRDAYLDLRTQLLRLLRAVRASADADAAPRLDVLDREARRFEARFRQQLFAMVRDGRIDGLEAGSLMNDLGYADRIYRGLRTLLLQPAEPESLRALRRLAGDADTGTDTRSTR